MASNTLGHDLLRRSRDPTRRAILARLALGDANVMELAEPFKMSQPAVSKHLKVLERAGLITRGRDAQSRPCRLNAARLKEAKQWTEATTAVFGSVCCDQLDELLNILKKKEAKNTLEEVSQKIKVKTEPSAADKRLARVRCTARPRSSRH